MYEVLRKEIYQSYEDILEGKPQREIDFPEFLDIGKYVCISDKIDDEEYKGRTCLAGKVKERN